MTKKCIEREREREREKVNKLYYFVFTNSRTIGCKYKYLLFTDTKMF